MVGKKAHLFAITGWQLHPKQLCENVIPSWKLFISEGVNTGLHQGSVEMIYEIIAGVASKT